MRTYLDFEKPIAELESKVAELKALAGEQHSVSIEEELAKLEKEGPRGPGRDLLRAHPLAEDASCPSPRAPAFPPLHRGAGRGFHSARRRPFFAEDQAIVGGIGRLSGRSVMVLGHEKGSDTEGRIKHNFGMARPEGYRKAVRLMEMADRFKLPVVSLVDTAVSQHRGRGARPGRGHRPLDRLLPRPRRADRRGRYRRGRLRRRRRHRHRQPGLHAGARDLHGRLPRGRGFDPVARLGARAMDAATNMKITAQDLLSSASSTGSSPSRSGAHRDGIEVMRSTGDTIVGALATYDDLSPAEIRKERREVPVHRSAGLKPLNRPKKRQFFWVHSLGRRLIIGAGWGSRRASAERSANFALTSHHRS